MCLTQGGNEGLRLARFNIEIKGLVVTTWQKKHKGARNRATVHPSVPTRTSSKEKETSKREVRRTVRFTCPLLAWLGWSLFDNVRIDCGR